ncbi:hypothetical protein LWI28_026845 [Acer negundo]|uniref:Uncharacterized protein n=1 Tax=Acer negundo TaxID=4023 RepID=A0AAD5IN75_ACENE|nr:hypothetical protein LWI28_026845 [Acer negundo]
MEGGVLKVVRGAFLAMKGTRQRNLYFLDGYTVTGRAAVSSNSDDEASDTSRLCHMRLGHVGEKALQGLVKQSLLKGAKTEALMYASHIVNRLPASALDGKTPKEVWSGQPVSDYDRLHIFGCPAYFHVTESKLDPRAKKAVFVGFSEGVNGFRLWNSESKKIILSRDVTFDESAMLKQTFRDTKNENPNSLQQVEFEVPKKSEKVSPTVDGPDDQDEISVEVEDSAPLSEIRQQPESIATSRPKRDIRKPARYTDIVAYALPVIDEGFAQGFSKVEKLDIVAYDEPTSFLKSGKHSLLEFKKSTRELSFKIGPSLSSSDEERLQQQELPGRCQYLILEDCQDPVKLEQALQSLSFLRGITVRESKEIKFFPEAGLPSQLRFIVIEECDALQSLPMAWMHDSNKSLEELSIRSCDSLTCIGRVQLPPNLKRLVINHCSNLLTVLDGEVVSGICKNTSCPSVTSLWSSRGNLPKALRYFSITECSKLESIAKGFHDNTKLEKLYIKDYIIVDCDDSVQDCVEIEESDDQFESSIFDSCVVPEGGVAYCGNIVQEKVVDCFDVVKNVGENVKNVLSILENFTQQIVEEIDLEVVNEVHIDPTKQVVEEIDKTIGSNILEDCGKFTVSVPIVPKHCTIQISSCKELVPRSIEDGCVMSSVHFLPGISSRMLLVEGFAKGSSKVLKLQMVEYSRGRLSLDIASVSKALDFFNFNFDYFMMREEEEELQKQELPCRVQYMALEDCKCPVKLEEALQNLSSLRGLSISVSPGIISFPEASLPSQLSFMVIRKCNALHSLPRAWMHSSNTSLKNLSIGYCLSLTSIARVQLPPNLKRLEIKYCTNLLTVLDEEEVSGSCKNTSRLEHLKIRYCPSLTSLWSKSNELPDTLRKIKLSTCSNLATLASSGNLPKSLRYLSIKGCSKLESIAKGFHDNTKLEKLYLQDCDSYLVIEVLKEMKQQGCPPNDVICYATISGMCNLLMKKKTAGMVLLGLKFSGFESKSEEKGCKLLPSLNCEARLSYVICSAVSGMYKDAILDEARKVFRDFRFERVHLPPNLKQLTILFCSNLVIVLDEEQVSGSCNNTACQTLPDRLGKMELSSCSNLATLASTGNLPKARATNNSSVTQQIYGLLTLLNGDIFKRECRIECAPVDSCC